MKNFLFSLFVTLSNFLNASTTSIIVPCYPGHVKYLNELITCYAEQTELPDEMIISLSDCNKIDRQELEIIKDRITAFPIIFIESPEILFAGQNRNAACSLATGDLLICQDADDLPQAQRIEMIKKTFDNKNIDVLCHRWVSTNELHKIETEYIFENLRILRPRRWVQHDMIDYVHYGNVSIRRKVFENVKWSRMKNGEDKTFIHQCMLKCFNFGILDAYLIVYRVEFSSGN